MRKTSKSNGTAPLKVSRHQLLQRDVFGRTILHISILSNAPNEFQSLLRNSDIKPILTATDYENGWNILHYIFFHKRLRCLTIFLEFLEQTSTVNSSLLADLLKGKDRCRKPPLALLQNDSKDLLWIPQYINENDEFHLAFRFSDQEQESNGLSRTFTSLRDSEIDMWDHCRGGSDAYVFGANSNNQLGVGDSTDRVSPSRLSGIDLRRTSVDSSDMKLSLQKPRIRQIALSKYHSALLTLDGRLFTCGIGSRGRLGHGNTSNVFRFKEVQGNMGAVQLVALSGNHTMILTESNELYSWGQNIYNQLGFTSVATSKAFKNSINDIYETSPGLVYTGDLKKVSLKILGIRATKIHSLAFSANAIYFWGLDIGQMGQPIVPKSIEHRINGVPYKGCIITSPKEVQFKDEIKSVATCETCTCVVTIANDLHIFYMDQRVKLPKLPTRIETRSQFDVFRPSRLTCAPVVKKVVMKSHEHVHVLLESGDVVGFSIQSSDSKDMRNSRYSYVWKAFDSDMRAVDIDNSYDGSLIVCTKNGSVYKSSKKSTLTQRRGSMTTATIPMFATFANSKFRMVEHVNRILRVSCDDSFSSFGLIRDDIDDLSYKLQKNEFFKDLESLSPLCESDSFRKQDQLLDVDHDVNTYITDYLYPTESSVTDEKNLLLKDYRSIVGTDSDQDTVSNDVLKQSQRKKYCFRRNPQPTFKEVYQLVAQYGKNDLLSMSQTIGHEKAFGDSKFCDGQIKFLSQPSISIRFHTKLFEYRSKFCRKLFNPEAPGEYFVHEGIEGEYDPKNKVLVFKSDVDSIAVMILVHFVYTNRELNVWDHHGSGSKCPPEVRKAKADYTKLMSLFGMDSLYGKDTDFLSHAEHLCHDQEGDVTVELKDGNRVCQSFILVATSAFFETILSGRWDNEDLLRIEDELEMKYVSLNNVTTLQFEVILKHLHGCNDLNVFDDFCSALTESDSTDDFVNLLLDMIEVADELLLVRLKHLCELAIKSFITLDNVLILLAHADWLTARKLFMSCCWYLYNNLELVMFDSFLADLDVELVRKVEEQVAFFDRCKHKDFVLGPNGEINHSLVKNPLSIDLVREFVSDISVFNEQFMSDRKGFSSFEPLLDIKMEAASEGRRKLSTRRMSRKNSIDPVPDLRFLSIASTVDRKVSDFAVTDEADFELVVRKRKVKPVSKDVSKDDAAQEEYSTEDNSIPGFSQAKDQAVVTKPTTPREAGQTSTPIALSSSNGTVRSGTLSWAASRNGSTSSIAPSSALVLGGIAESKKQTKIKFAPSMKVSQKQRRKLVQTPAEGSSSELSTSPQLKNPWGVTPLDSTRVEALPDLLDLPALGEKPQLRPSLSAIMLQEATKVEDLKQDSQVTRTLQDVQQEQEFAKWWEEECKRVQMEEGHPGSRGERDGRGGRGRRGKRRGGRT